jgi:hypothetical protein
MKTQFSLTARNLELIRNLPCAEELLTDGNKKFLRRFLRWNQFLYLQKHHLLHVYVRHIRRKVNEALATFEENPHGPVPTVDLRMTQSFDPTFFECVPDLVVEGIWTIFATAGICMIVVAALCVLAAVSNVLSYVLGCVSGYLQGLLGISLYL